MSCLALISPGMICRLLTIDYCTFHKATECAGTGALATLLLLQHRGAERGAVALQPLAAHPQRGRRHRQGTDPKHPVRQGVVSGGNIDFAQPPLLATNVEAYLQALQPGQHLRRHCLHHRRGGVHRHAGTEAELCLSLPGSLILNIIFGLKIIFMLNLDAKEYFLYFPAIILDIKL